MSNAPKYLKQYKKQFQDLQYYVLVVNIEVSIFIGVTPCGLIVQSEYGDTTYLQYNSTKLPGCM